MLCFVGFPECTDGRWVELRATSQATSWTLLSLHNSPTRSGCSPIVLRNISSILLTRFVVWRGRVQRSETPASGSSRASCVTIIDEVHCEVRHGVPTATGVVQTLTLQLVQEGKSYILIQVYTGSGVIYGMHMNSTLGGARHCKFATHAVK